MRSSKGSRNRILIGAVLLFAVLTAWAFWNAQNKPPASERSDVVGTEPGERAPDFNLLTLEGNQYRLEDGAGKPRIVFFMAYWCGTCIPEALALNQVRQVYGDVVEIVVIDVDPTSTPELLATFKSWTGNGDFVWGFDQSQEITNTYRVRSLDTTLVIDEEGYIIFKDERPTLFETFVQVLSEMGL